MSHTKADEEREDYQSIQDQVRLLNKELSTLEYAATWPDVHLAIAQLRKRINYMYNNYGK